MKAMIKPALGLLGLVVTSGCMASLMVQGPSAPPPSGRMRLLYEACDGVEGILVNHVEPGGAAERAGIARGDILASIDGVGMTYGGQVPETLLERRRPGETIRVAYAHDGQWREAMITLDPAPPVTGSITGFAIGGCRWRLPPR
jgi:S1-C subfamily serine protease